MGRSRHRAMDKVPARNIELACEHPEGLATLHRDEESAWCPVCEADVKVAHIPLNEEVRDA